MPALEQLLARRRDVYVGWLKEACAIPSHAGDPEGLDAMRAWLAERLAAVGAEVEVVPAGDAPAAVFAQAGAGERTLLLYGHYDVEPPGSLAAWSSPPFAAAERDGRIVARGAADNKGDLVARLAALDALGAAGGLPVTVKLLVEGAEETGSPGLAEVVARLGARLAADGCVWEGAGRDGDGRPLVQLGVKGMLAVELRCHSHGEEMHSAFAGLVESPAWRLVQALASLRDADGRVRIAGFYDDVVPPSEQERRLLDRYPLSPGVAGEPADREEVAVLFGAPTCNVSAIRTSGGDVAHRCIVPTEAAADVDLRLVPGQDPQTVLDQLGRHLRAAGFDDVEAIPWTLEPAVSGSPNSPLARAVSLAAERTFGQPPVVAPRSPGTGPVAALAAVAGPVVEPPGVWRPDANIHAPDESCRIDDFLATIAWTADCLQQFANLDASPGAPG